MSKPKKHEFATTSENLYNAISKMLLLNAQAIDQKYSDCNDISKINYTYGEKNKINVQVTKANPFEEIVYHTAMENRERYDVQFKLIESVDKTTLEYDIQIVTDIKKIETNYNFMRIFYSFKQKKAFKQMCVYLQTLINEM